MTAEYREIKTTWDEVVTGDQVTIGNVHWTIMDVMDDATNGNFVVTMEDPTGKQRTSKPGQLDPGRPVTVRRAIEVPPVPARVDPAAYGLTYESDAPEPVRVEVDRDRADAALSAVTTMREAAPPARLAPNPAEQSALLAPDVGLELVPTLTDDEREEWIKREAVFTGQTVAEVRALVDEVDPVDPAAHALAEDATNDAVTDAVSTAISTFRESGKVFADQATALLDLDPAYLARHVPALLAELQLSVNQIMGLIEDLGAIALTNGPEPTAADMTGERAAVEACTGAGLDPEMVGQLLTRDDLIKHLTEAHGIKPVGKARGITLIEHRARLADQHFAEHRTAGFDKAIGATPHRHVAYDRPTDQ